MTNGGIAANLFLMRLLKTCAVASRGFFPPGAVAQVVSWCNPTTYTDGTAIETSGGNALAGVKFYCGSTPGTYSVVMDLGMGAPDYSRPNCGSAPAYSSAFGVPFRTNYCTMTAYTASNSESQYSPEVAFNWPLTSSNPDIPFAPQNIMISRRGWFDLALSEPRSSVVLIGRRSEQVKKAGENFTIGESLSIMKRMAELKAAGAGRPERALSAPKAEIRLADAGDPSKG